MRRSTTYKGHWIEFDYYGKGEYTVFHDGDDVWFATEEGAKKFIDQIESEDEED